MYRRWRQLNRRGTPLSQRKQSILVNNTEPRPLLQTNLSHSTVEHESFYSTVGSLRKWKTVLVGNDFKLIIGTSLFYGLFYER